MSTKILRVELDNFKSYNGKVAIGPFKDFTCIVGPNGAGKSNLMDALSFVLSSASTATMRGKNITDLINRKAKGQKCSVTLVLQHTAGASRNPEEVSFTRRLSPNGDSTLLVNEKEVNEKKFMTTLAQHHVGARLNTFLVFQHEVEAVAQKKARQLTELLEEVSGSAEMKTDYNAKKAALEAANEALTAASLEKRGATMAVNQMRLAKKQAEQFDALRRQVAEEKRNLALAELFALEMDIEKQKAALERHVEQLSELEKSIASEDEIRQMKRGYATRHKSYLEDLKAARKAADELRNKHNTVERIKATLAHLTRRYEHQQDELVAARKADMVRSTEVLRVEEELKKQKALLEQFDKECAKEDQKAVTLSQSLQGAQMAEYRALRKEADCNTVTLRQKAEAIVRQRESAKEAQKQCDRALEVQAAQAKEIGLTTERAEAHGADLEARRKELEDTIATLTKDIAAAKKELVISQRKSREREMELAKVEEQLHELRFTKDLNKQNNRMAEALQSLRSMFPIRGRLVDLCTVPNERHRNAITVAMGKNLEAIIVDSTEVAIACVRHLKEQRMAPMTFLPLDAVQGKAVDDRLRTFGGSCKPAVDVVQFDSELEPAVRYALGQTLLCDTLAEGKGIAYGRPNGERFKVVTLDGTMLLKNGSVQGGLASVQNRARKWDEKKYEDLRAAREKLLKESAGGSESELARAQIAIRDMEARLEFAEKRKAVVSTEAAANAEKVRKLREEVTRLKPAEEELTQRKKRYTSEEQSLSKELLDVSKSISQEEGRVFAEFQKKVNIPGLLQLEETDAQRAKVRATRRGEMQLLIHKLQSSLEMELKRANGNRLGDAEEMSSRLEKDMEQCKKDMTAYTAVVAKSEKTHKDARAATAKGRAELDQLEAKIRQATRSSEADLGRLSQFRKEVTALQAACDTMRLRRLGLVRRCQMDEIGVPLVAAASSGGKRVRGEEAAASQRRGRGGRPAADDAMSQLLLSEPFALVAAADAPAGKSSQSSSVSDKESMMCIDFSGMSDVQRRTASQSATLVAHKQKTESAIEGLTLEMEALAPNMKIASRMSSSEDRLGTSSSLLDGAREAANKAHAAFTKIKEERTERFNTVFKKVADSVDKIYRELTMGTRAYGVQGSAYLMLQDAEEPYLGGTTYHATPPMKRYMPMGALSGGERTMAALALLFAIHEVSSTPFFVLDEVDAALDASNVEKLAEYLRTRSSKCQFIVVSLKDQLYHKADELVGVMKDKERETSKVVTMDLSGYAF